MDEGLRECLSTVKLAAKGTNQLHGGKHVKKVAGICPAAAALEPLHVGQGGGQREVVIDNDPTLRTAATSDCTAPTPSNLIMLSDYAVIAGTANRNVMDVRVAEMLAAAGDAEFPEALENTGGADGDYEENED